MAKPDSNEDRSSKKPKPRSFFSIRNGVILLLAVGFLAVGARMLGLFGKPAGSENVTAIQDQPIRNERERAPQARSVESSSTQASTHAAAGKTAADLMDKKFIALAETLTAGQAVERLKEKEIDAEHPEPVYVIDSLGRLVGECAPGKVLVAPEDTPLKEIMVPDVKALEINTAATEVAARMQQSNAPVMPVVDMAGRLVGLVSSEALKARAASEASAAAGSKHAEKRNRASEGEVQAVHAKSPAAVAPAGETAQSVEKHETVADEHAGKAGTARQVSVRKAAEEGETEATAGEQAHAAKAAKGEEAARRVHEPAAEAAKAKGVAFVEAAVKPLKYELEDRFWGWRPNDILDFTDNVNQFQLGVLEVTRRTAVALAERISRTGTIEAFDANVQNAMNWFMVKSNRYWLPSPEYKYRAGIKELEKYKERLQRGEATFYTRQDNLIPLLLAFKDLLGSCEENLVKSKEEDGSPVSFFKADDYFYYAQGVASAMHTILEAVAEDFKVTVESRRGMQELEHAIHWCHAATEIHPWLILDSSPSSIFANHRANLAAPISHARFHLGVLIRTLST